jgi:chromosome segregation ATPase
LWDDNKRLRTENASLRLEVSGGAAVEVSMDLVERLRENAGPSGEWGEKADKLHIEAAEEIERLREWQRQMVEIQASGGRLDGYRELAQKLADRDAEIDRLRAEAESFHMDYRMKCDEETRAQAVEIEKLEHAADIQASIIARLRAENASLRLEVSGLESSPMSEEALDILRSENAAQLAELHRISDALGTMEGPSSVDHIVALRARLDWILDNMRQTDLMLMLPKYTGDRSGLYAAIDAARKGEQK